jgi:hypothetical protein
MVSANCTIRFRNCVRCPLLSGPLSALICSREQAARGARLVLPPGVQAVDDEVTGLGRAAKPQEQFAAVLIDDAERDVLLFTAHVVIGCPVVAARLAAARIRADVDRRLAVHAQAHDARVVPPVFGLEVGEDGIGLRNFFSGLALRTARSR